MFQLMHTLLYKLEPIFADKMDNSENGYVSICPLPHIAILFALRDVCYVHEKGTSVCMVPFYYCKSS